MGLEDMVIDAGKIGIFAWGGLVTGGYVIKISGHKKLLKKIDESPFLEDDEKRILKGRQRWITALPTPLDVAYLHISVNGKAGDAISNMYPRIRKGYKGDTIPKETLMAGWSLIECLTPIGKNCY